MLTLLSGIMLLGFAQSARGWRRGRTGGSGVFPAIANSGTPGIALTASIRPADRSSGLCRAITGWSFTAGGDIISPEASGYRPAGAGFRHRCAPVGLFLPFLPPYYATVWVGGRPYYYANEIYYAHRGDGYVVVEPPQGDVSQAPPPADQLFIYPRQNQSEEQQTEDRYECHRWAVSQTGFDPTQSSGAVPADQSGQKRADYQRAMSACLDGRGYTVK